MKTEWIPISERLPDFLEFVLIAIPGRSLPSIAVAFLTDLDETKRTWMTCSFTFYSDFEVTHWVALPELPKVINENLHNF